MRSNISATSKVTSLLVLFAIIAGSIVPAFAQTRRRPALRRGGTTTAVRKATPVQPAQPAIRYHSVPADTVMRVRMNEKISSGNSRVGDRFTTTVVDPVYVHGVEVVPAGSKITGRVTAIDRASRRSKAGTIEVKFVSLELPNGSDFPINGTLTSLQADDVNVDNEGEVEGRSAVKRNTVFIGGGAATGALIGAIAGGGKGAGVGAGGGAGLGGAGARFSKGHEAEVNPGTEFGVLLSRAVTLPESRVRRYDY